MPRLISHHLFAFAIASLFSACAGTPANHADSRAIVDLAALKLPQVAGEYVTSREGSEQEPEHDHHEQAAEPVSWRFWRDNQSITIERPQLAMGEHWQRDGRTIIHRKLYHGDRRAIEFQDDDLRMLETTPSWQKLALLIDPSLLEKLRAGELEWHDAYPSRDYQGEVEGTQWLVVMRMDLGLPVLIERKKGDFAERTELLQAHTLESAPWQPTPDTGYDVIDFADLGDKEYDPFVIKVQAQMGHAHQH